MEKAWAWLPRNSLEYEIGARNFVAGASSSLSNPTEMFCPCVDCRNVCHQLIETVLDHLVIRGMDEKYKRNPCWSKHGDMRDRTSGEVPTSEKEAYELMRTAFFDSEFSDEQPSKQWEPVEESEFREKLEDAETLLNISAYQLLNELPPKKKIRFIRDSEQKKLVKIRRTEGTKRKWNHIGIFIIVICVNF